MWRRQRTVITWALAVVLAATALLGDGLHLLLDPSHLLHWASCSDHGQLISRLSGQSDGLVGCAVESACCHRRVASDQRSSAVENRLFVSAGGQHHPDHCGVCRLLAMSQHHVSSEAVPWTSSTGFAEVRTERPVLLPRQRAPQSPRAPPVTA